MNQFHSRFSWVWSILVVCALAFAMGGCEGDDGAQGTAGVAGQPGQPGQDGADGATGPEGPPGPGASVTPLESCAVCHDEGSFADANAFHAVTGVPTVSNVALADAAGDLQITFNLLIDGEPVDDFTTVTSAYVHTAADGATNGIDDVANPITVVPGANAGDFTATITGGTALAGAAARFFLRVGDGETRAVVSGDFPAAALPDIAADASCGNCHGPKGLAPHTAFGYPGMEASECVVCHKAEIDGLGFLNFEDSWVGLVHGIHNAHDFPEGVYTYGADTFDTTYPTYMSNCSVCHSEAPQLAAANAMPVSGEGCFTCHGSMDGFNFTGGLEFHLNVPEPETADCTTGCHNGGFARATVAEFHNGIITERDGVIWDGVDASVAEGAKFDWQITGVVDDGTNLAISWIASYDGVGVDPCNATAAAGAPVFHADDAEAANLSMLRSYAQGDDFILGQSTSAPGQASNVGVSNDNTTCAGNVATTTIPVDDVDAERGIVALQGKPRVPNVDPAPDPASSFVEEFGSLMPVRAVTPTYEWLVGSGDAPLATRRAIVDTAKCLDCHEGSLYQHGGNRVDNVDMCNLCHNPASNEKNRRVAMGVDASEAYDGGTGETFEMKTMLHRIHSAGVEDQPPYVIYRSRGIYAFAPDVSLVPNWDVVSTEGCTDDEIARGERLVFGGDPESSTSCQPHNFHSATYPRLLNDCAGCHVEGFAVHPDQTKAMATTVEAGSEIWEDQVDDVLQGAGTTACVTCHADGASRGHAYQNSWEPQEFEDGRQTIIDAAR